MLFFARHEACDDFVRHRAGKSPWLLVVCLFVYPINLFVFRLLDGIEKQDLPSLMRCCSSLGKFMVASSEYSYFIVPISLMPTILAIALCFGMTHFKGFPTYLVY